MQRGQFSLRYLLLETAVVALAACAWRFTLLLPSTLQPLGWLLILLTTGPAVCGAFGQQQLRSAIWFSLATCLLLAVCLSVLEIAAMYGRFAN
jgi:hypothetical protein